MGRHREMILHSPLAINMSLPKLTLASKASTEQSGIAKTDHDGRQLPRPEARASALLAASAT